MGSLNIPATDSSPKVIFDRTNNVFEIEGESRPENVFNFYHLIINNLYDFFEKNDLIALKNSFAKKPFTAHFKLTYFNSSSAKLILDILNVLKTHVDKGLNIKIYWYYHENDIDLREAGEELADMIDADLNYVMIKSAN